jgi:hypothetical protein
VLRDIAQRESASKGAREQAIFWLGNRRDTSSTAFLRGLYSKLTDKDLKEKVLFLRGQPARLGQRPVAAQYRDQRARVDRDAQAGALLGRQQQGGDGRGHRGLYDKVNDKEMKEQVIFVLSQNSKDTRPSTSSWPSRGATPTARCGRRPSSGWDRLATHAC